MTIDDAARGHAHKAAVALLQTARWADAQQFIVGVQRAYPGNELGATSLGAPRRGWAAPLGYNVGPWPLAPAVLLRSPAPARGASTAAQPRHSTGIVPVVGETMNNRARKRLIYRRHRIGLLIAAIESLMALEESMLQAKQAA